MRDHRRLIRDTVADDYKPAWKIEMDKRLTWLDRLEAVLSQPLEETECSLPR